MVSDSTLCIDTTCTRARINTLVSLACFIRGTIWVYNTFGSACHIRISKVFRDALTGCCPISSLANSIISTGSWVAGIYNFCSGRNSRFEVTTSERITLIARITDTAWSMIINPTGCMHSAYPWARINTFILYTSQVGFTFWICSAFWLTFYIWITK